MLLNHSRSDFDLRRPTSIPNRRPFNPYGEVESDEDKDKDKDKLRSFSNFLPSLQDESYEQEDPSVETDEDDDQKAIQRRKAQNKSATSSSSTDHQPTTESDYSSSSDDTQSQGRPTRTPSSGQAPKRLRDSAGSPELHHTSSIQPPFRTYSAFWGLSRTDSTLTSSQTMTPPRDPDSPQRPKHAPEPPEKRHRARFPFPESVAALNYDRSALRLPVSASVGSLTSSGSFSSSKPLSSSRSTSSLVGGPARFNAKVPPSFPNPFYTPAVTDPPMPKKGAEPVEPGGTVPRLIGDFVIAHSSQTTVGETSRVTFAKHRLDGMLYAIKTKLSSGSTIREQLREVHAMAALGRHANLVAYFGSWIDEAGHLSVQMEWCNGTLYSDITGRLVYTPKELVSAGRDLLSALKHVHAHGLLHLDVKPENIFYVRTPERKLFKLGDLGLVKRASEAEFGDEGDGQYYKLDSGDKPTAFHDLQALGFSLSELSLTVPLIDFLPPLLVKWLNGSLTEDLRCSDMLYLLQNTVV